MGMVAQTLSVIVEENLCLPLLAECSILDEFWMIPEALSLLVMQIAFLVVALWWPLCHFGRILSTHDQLDLSVDGLLLLLLRN